MYSAFNDFPSSSLDKSSSILERASLLSCRMSPLKCLVCPMKSALRSTTRYLNTRRSYAKDYEPCVRGWFPYQGLRLSPMPSCFWDFGLLRARISENGICRKFIWLHITRGRRGARLLPQPPSAHPRQRFALLALEIATLGTWACCCLECGPYPH